MCSEQFWIHVYLCASNLTLKTLPETKNTHFLKDRKEASRRASSGRDFKKSIKSPRRSQPWWPFTVLMANLNWPSPSDLNTLEKDIWVEAFMQGESWSGIRSAARAWEINRRDVWIEFSFKKELGKIWHLEEAGWRRSNSLEQVDQIVKLGAVIGK